jgi:enoyl-CoA hydratase
MMTSSAVHYRRDGKVATITLDRPPVNAYDDAMLIELQAAWRTAADDEEARVIVLRAEGRHFCAGGDLTEAEEDADHAPPADDWEIQRNLPKPTIAAVQGACVAGGQRFVWPCDLIVAADDAVFRDPLVAAGIPGIPAHGHTWEYGPRLAKEMLYKGTPIPAERARRSGMVNRVVPREHLDEEVMGLAREIAEMDPFALAQAKRAVNQTMDIIGQHYIVNRFQELMLGFDMARVHARHRDGGD